MSRFLTGKTYHCFSVLHFDLSSLPYIFTQRLKPLIKYWKEKGKRIVVYLDYGFSMHQVTNESCLELSNTVKVDLTLTGIMIQKKKIELQNYIE